MNVHEIAAAVSSRRASAVEIVRATLDRMAAAKALNAVVTVDAERSLPEAAVVACSSVKACLLPASPL